MHLDFDFLYLFTTITANQTVLVPVIAISHLIRMIYYTVQYHYTRQIDFRLACVIMLFDRPECGTGELTTVRLASYVKIVLPEFGKQLEELQQHWQQIAHHFRLVCYESGIVVGKAVARANGFSR